MQSSELRVVRHRWGKFALGALALSIGCGGAVGVATDNETAAPNCIQTEGGKRCFVVQDGLAITNGDIILGQAETVLAAAAQQGRSAQAFWLARPGFWSNGVVPYVVQPGFSAAGINRLNTDINQYNATTAIRWVPRTTQSDYVVLQPTSYCNSYLGRIGGAQPINLERNGNCAVAHEMGHALGMEHEQSRPDRNSYVVVHYENVQSGQEPQFDIVNGQDTSGTYDVHSLMQYDSMAFSKNGQPTILLPSGGRIDYAWNLSPQDIAWINHHYTTYPIPPRSASCGFIGVGQGIGPGGVVSSCDGRFSLTLQGDGNLVHYWNGRGPIWATNSREAAGFALIMQPDGNLVLYSGRGAAIWAAGTFGRGGATLSVQNDGNLVIYQGGAPIWASGTSGH
jgi:hypothetical protein